MAEDSLDRNRDTDFGTVRISNDVITQIAVIAAMEVKGVYKMGQGTGWAVLERIIKASRPRGVKVATKDSELKLTLFIITEYGIDIPKVADEVQANTKRAVEKATGLVISEVNVIVEGVHAQGVFEKEKK